LSLSISLSLFYRKPLDEREGKIEGHLFHLHFFSFFRIRQFWKLKNCQIVSFV
jgi:hypothetical protein